jgi:hypothetical protein
MHKITFYMYLLHLYLRVATTRALPSAPTPEDTHAAAFIKQTKNLLEESVKKSPAKTKPVQQAALDSLLATQKLREPPAAQPTGRQTRSKEAPDPVEGQEGQQDKTDRQAGDRQAGVNSKNKTPDEGGEEEQPEPYEDDEQDLDIISQEADSQKGLDSMHVDESSSGDDSAPQAETPSTPKSSPLVGEPAAVADASASPEKGLPQASPAKAQQPESTANEPAADARARRLANYTYADVGEGFQKVNAYARTPPYAFCA